MVLPYIDLNPPWVYMCSPSWTPLPPPSPSHPSGSSQWFVIKIISLYETLNALTLLWCYERDQVECCWPPVLHQLCTLCLPPLHTICTPSDLLISPYLHTNCHTVLYCGWQLECHLALHMLCTPNVLLHWARSTSLVLCTRFASQISCPALSAPWLPFSPVQCLHIIFLPPCSAPDHQPYGPPHSVKGLTLNILLSCIRLASLLLSWTIQSRHTSTLLSVQGLRTFCPPSLP